MNKADKDVAARKVGRIVWTVSKAVFKCLMSVLLVGTITACIVCCVMAVYLFSSFEGDNEIIDLSSITDRQSSMLIVSDGKGGYTEQRLEGVNSIWVELEDKI